MTRQPWELTDAECRAFAEQDRSRLLAADRVAAPLFVTQLAESDDESTGVDESSDEEE